MNVVEPQLHARKISTVSQVLAAVAGEHVLDVYRPCTGAPIVPTVTQLARAHTDCGSAGWPVIKSPTAVLRDSDNVPAYGDASQIGTAHSHTSNVAMMPLYLTVDS